MPRLARRAGIEKRVHAHGLRHTHAAELALEGKPMNLIQAQLGHSSPRRHRYGPVRRPTSLASRALAAEVALDRIPERLGEVE
jgi:integrase